MRSLPKTNISLWLYISVIQDLIGKKFVIREPSWEVWPFSEVKGSFPLGVWKLSKLGKITYFNIFSIIVASIFLWQDTWEGNLGQWADRSFNWCIQLTCYLPPCSLPTREGPGYATEDSPLRRGWSSSCPLASLLHLWAFFYGVS